MIKIVFCLILLTLSSFSDENLNEAKIHRHLSNALHWAHLYQYKSCLFSESEIKRELGLIKFSQPSLVQSAFYKDFLSFKNFDLNKKKSLKDLTSSIESTRIKLKLPKLSLLPSSFIPCL